jgi:hypothetical protein
MRAVIKISQIPISGWANTDYFRVWLFLQNIWAEFCIQTITELNILNFRGIEVTSAKNSAFRGILKSHFRKNPSRIRIPKLTGIFAPKNG